LSAKPHDMDMDDKSFSDINT